MKKEHYDSLKSALDLTINSISPDIKDIYISEGYTRERYAWDMLHLSKFDTSILYDAGLNDSHIQTALFKITGPYLALSITSWMSSDMLLVD